MEYILLLLIFVFILCLFFHTYPPFGGKTSRKINQRSTNFKNGKFVNQVPTSMKLTIADITALIKAEVKRGSGRKPARTVIPERLDISAAPDPLQPQITWFGHSTFLLQLNSKNILLDPMFSRSPSPIQAIGPQRFSDRMPANIEDLPSIDAVLLSHDHYDHLDYSSIKKLASKTTMFFVPLGLAAHLIKWGVTPEHITELDWWDERTFEGFRFACTPARHFSGRTLTDQFATLWCSWVIDAGQTTIYFSGDTGYGPHFKQIGKKYGPFDLTLLECGQYDTRWSMIHMTPEQTVQAHQDLGGNRMIPMHWGAFGLSLHTWTDPIERVVAAGAKIEAAIMTPKIGEVVRFTATSYPTFRWWDDYTKK